DVAIIQMESPGAEHLRREIELLDPIRDDWFSKEAFAPLIHLGRHLLSRLHEYIVAMNGELEIALVIERHARNLPESIFAVEHPPVGSRQESVRDVANALVDWRVRFGCWTCALNPLTAKVGRNLAANEVAVARVLDFDVCSSYGRGCIQELDSFFIAKPRRSPGCTASQNCSPFSVKFSQHFESVESLSRENILVLAFK